MNSKIILIVVVMLLATGGVVYYVTLQEDKSPQESIKETSVDDGDSVIPDIDGARTEPDAEDKPEEVAGGGWQTYKNEEFNLEFEYPNDWYHGGGPRGDNQFLICLNPKGMAGDCIGLVTISWNIDFDKRYSAIKKLFEKYEVTESETTISNVPAKMFVVSGYEKGREGFTRELFFERSGLIYNIAVIYGKEGVFDHIVKSFKILKN